MVVVSFPEKFKVFKQTTENSSGCSHSHREGVEKLMCHYLVITGDFSETKTYRQSMGGMPFL